MFLIFFNSSWLGRLFEMVIRFCRSFGPCRDSRGIDDRFGSRFCKERAKAYPDGTGRVKPWLVAKRNRAVTMKTNVSLYNHFSAVVLDADTPVRYVRSRRVTHPTRGCVSRRDQPWGRRSSITFSSILRTDCWHRRHNHNSNTIPRETLEYEAVERSFPMRFPSVRKWFWAVPRRSIPSVEWWKTIEHHEEMDEQPWSVGFLLRVDISDVFVNFRRWEKPRAMKRRRAEFDSNSASKMPNGLGFTRSDSFPYAQEISTERIFDDGK